MRPSGDPVLVILDSDHRKEHVEQELEIYATLIGPGDYIVVEDTNINGHPVLPKYGPGPHEAVEAFLDRHREFRRDRSREKFLLTFNPGGYLQHAGAAAWADFSAVDVHSDDVRSVDPYDLDIEHGETPLDQMLEQQKGAERALTLLAEVSTAFGEAMRQLDDARRVGDGFRGAVRELEYASQRERRLQEELGKLTSAFDEAMKQLAAASVAAEGFRAAMEMLERMRARQSDLAARVLMLEEELRQSQHREAVGQRETGTEGMNSDGRARA
jgi:BMFP domain-containing protein YqiC